MVCQELISRYAREHVDEVAASVDFERFDQNQQVKQLVLDWFVDAKKMRDCQYPYCFDAFTTLWRALNGWAECISNQEQDHRWLDALMLNQQMQEAFVELLEHDNQFSVIADS